MPLTNLYSVKQYMGGCPDSSDAKLNALIAQVSSRIERITGRHFAADDYLERHNGKNEGELVLREYPVSRVNRLAYGDGAGVRIEHTVSTDVLATASVTPTSLRLYRMDAGGTQTTAELLIETYPTLALLAAQVNLTAGFSATVENNAPSKYLNPLGGINITDTGWTLSYADQDDVEFWVDNELGVVSYRIIGVPHGFQNITVDYRAGYDTIPGDLEMLANEIIADMFNQSQTNQAVQSESLGDYSYTTGAGGGASAATGGFTASHLEKLKRWARIPIAVG